MVFAVTYTKEPTEPAEGAKPGTTKLLGFLVDESPWADLTSSFGVYEPRDINGNQWPNWNTTGSQHAAGRAGDAAVPTDRPKGHPVGHEIASWLTKYHEELGIQEVIWAARRWKNTDLRWRAYTGRSDHFDHVHFAQNADGAAGLTIDAIRAVAPGEDDMSAEDIQEIKAALKKLSGAVAKVQGDLDTLKPYSAERFNRQGKKVPTGGVVGDPTVRWTIETVTVVRQLERRLAKVEAKLNRQR